MKSTFNTFGLLFFTIFIISSCDSSTDSTTPTPTPSTFEFLFIKSPPTVSGVSTNWNLKNELTAGAGFSLPTNLRIDAISSGPSFGSILINQCSAYDKVNKKYVVSSGERIVIYDVSTTTPTPPTIYMVNGTQAIEFVNGRCFMIHNNILKEYNISTGTVVSSFTPITLAAGNVSNLTFYLNNLYVISGSSLYTIDTTGSGSITSTYTLSGNSYEGLEYINSTGCPNQLYAVKKLATGANLIKIVNGIETVFSTVTLPHPIYGKYSSALDYTTEFYYLNGADIALNGTLNGTTTTLVIDLTPTSGILTATGLNSSDYLFGLQLKD